MLQLYNVNHSKIDGLTYCKDIKRERELSGFETLSFSYPQADAKCKLIQNEGFVRTKDNEYVIKEVNPKTDWTEVVCRVNTDDLYGKEFESFNLNDNLQNVANTALVGTGWTAWTDITKVRNIKLKYKNAVSIVSEIIGIWNCDVWFDAINKIVYFYAAMGSDKGAYFIDRLNLKELEAQGTTYDFITRLIPLGEKNLDITSVNGGLNYIDNNKYSNKIITGYWRTKQYTDPQALKDDAIIRLNKYSQPVTAYSAKVIDLAKANPKYSILSYGLGDIVTLVDKIKGINTKVRIVKSTEYLLEPEKNEVEIANRKQLLQDMQISLMDAAETTDNITNGDGGTIDGSTIDSVDTSQLTGIQNLKLISAQITDLSTACATIFNAQITQATISTAQIGNLSATVATITNGIINNAKIDAANVNNLSTNYAHITNGIIDNASINGADIANASITNVQIASGTIGTAQITNAAITTAKIADAQITDAKLDRASVNKIQIGTADIKDANITTAKIADGNITNAKIGSLAVSTANIQNAAITNAKIDRASANKLVIMTADIGDAQIVTAKIADAQITGAKIASATILTANISDAQITTAKISNAAITTALIADAAIGTTQIADASITDGKIVNLTAGRIKSGVLDTSLVSLSGTNGNLLIKNNRLQVFDNQSTPIERISLGDVNNDGSVFAFRVRGADGKTMLMDENGVHSEGITDGAITNNKISGAANIDGSKLLDNSIAGGKLVIDSITAREIAARSVTANELALNTITAQSGIIANAAITTAMIGDAQITNAKIDSVSAGKVKTGLLQSTNNQSWMNLDTGTFSLGNGRLSYDGSTFNINFTGTSLETQLNSKANQSDITQMHNYLNFDDINGLIIGKAGSPFQITISNTEMDFKQSGTTIAYVNGQQMSITDLRVLDSAIIGVHKIEEYNNNITLIRWVGGAS